MNPAGKPPAASGPRNAACELDIDLPIGLDGARRARVCLPTQRDKIVVHDLSHGSANAALLEELWISRMLVRLGEQDLTALGDLDRQKLVERLYGQDVRAIVDAICQLARQFGDGQDRCPMCGNILGTNWPG